MRGCCNHTVARPWDKAFGRGSALGLPQHARGAGRAHSLVGKPRCAALLFVHTGPGRARKHPSTRTSGKNRNRDEHKHEPEHGHLIFLKPTSPASSIQTIHLDSGDEQLVERIQQAVASQPGFNASAASCGTPPLRSTRAMPCASCARATGTLTWQPKCGSMRLRGGKVPMWETHKERWKRVWQCPSATLDSLSPEERFVRKHWMSYFMGNDRRGLPVHVVRCGTSDPAGFVREVGVDAFIMNIVLRLEYCFEMTAALGYARCDFVEVFDLRPCGEPHWLRRGREGDQVLHGPCTHPGHMLPGPHGARVHHWDSKGVQHCLESQQTLDPRGTKKKIHIYAVDAERAWVRDLENLVEIGQIPQEMGGDGDDGAVLRGGLVRRGSLDLVPSKEA